MIWPYTSFFQSLTWPVKKECVPDISRTTLIFYKKLEKVGCSTQPAKKWKGLPILAWIEGMRDNLRGLWSNLSFGRWNTLEKGNWILQESLQIALYNLSKITPLFQVKFKPLKPKFWMAIESMNSLKRVHLFPITQPLFFSQEERKKLKSPIANHGEPSIGTKLLRCFHNCLLFWLSGLPYKKVTKTSCLKESPKTLRQINWEWFSRISTET